MLTLLLKYFRDTRLVWDVMGPVYNRRIYDAIAELYDHIVRELEPAVEAMILDAGTGRGYISLTLAAQNPQSSIIGIDYSPMQIRAAEKLRRKRKITNCSFLRNNVMDIRFDDNVFDAAVSVGSIKHWPDGLKGLREIYRVLKPGEHSSSLKPTKRQRMRPSGNLSGVSASGLSRMDCFSGACAVSSSDRVIRKRAWRLSCARPGSGMSCASGCPRAPTLSSRPVNKGSISPRNKNWNYIKFSGSTSTVTFTALSVCFCKSSCAI
jgi:SAM-dependent methyltransferase